MLVSPSAEQSTYLHSYGRDFFTGLQDSQHLLFTWQRIWYLLAFFENAYFFVRKPLVSILLAEKANQRNFDLFDLYRKMRISQHVRKEHTCDKISSATVKDLAHVWGRDAVEWSRARGTAELRSAESQGASHAEAYDPHFWTSRIQQELDGGAKILNRLLKVQLTVQLQTPAMLHKSVHIRSRMAHGSDKHRANRRTCLASATSRPSFPLYRSGIKHR